MYNTVQLYSVQSTDTGCYNKSQRALFLFGGARCNLFGNLGWCLNYVCIRDMQVLCNMYKYYMYCTYILHTEVTYYLRTQLTPLHY